jgi:hypothetical protein
MADDNSGCAMLLIIPLIVLAIAAAVVALMLALSAGSLFGSGTALYNYVQAFRNNVKPERA